MKLEEQARHRKHAGRYGQGRRFYTKLDMAIIKHDAAVRNSKAKRGEIAKHPNEYISVCGCGVEGCFIHSGWETKMTQEEYDKHIAWMKKFYSKGT